jgi:hypothetical protein
MDKKQQASLDYLKAVLERIAARNDKCAEVARKALQEKGK